MQGGLETGCSCVHEREDPNGLLRTEHGRGHPSVSSSGGRPRLAMLSQLPLRITSSTLESVVNAIDPIHLSPAGWAPVRR